jgi:NO-binding membrane sensor protein with MHYT domain
MRDRMWVSCLACLAGAVTVGLTDLVASEVQPAVALLLGFGALLGFLERRWAWAWGLVLGLSVFWAHALAAVVGYEVPYAVEPNLLATFLALIPAILGSGAGAAVRAGLDRRASPRTSPAADSTRDVEAR